MNGSRTIGFLSLAGALAVACGGSTSSQNPAGTDGGASGSAADTGIGSSGASSGSSAGVGTVPNDSGMVIVTNVECPPNSNPPSLCLAGESCCSTTTTPDAGGPTTTAYSCVASVASCGGQATSCSSSLQCKTGQVCCREPLGDAGAARNQVCEETACPSTATQLCNDTNECPTGMTCSGGGTCRVPACTGKTSCSGGEICCLAAGRGAVAACQATCAMGEAQVCQASTECSTGQTCMGGGGGGGAMTCGVPPCTGAASCPTGQYCCDMGRTGPACQVAACGMGAQVCAATTECAAGETCQAQGQGQPMICATPPCTAGSCAAGMVCCSTGGGTCETGATCLTGVQLCTMTADCAAGLVCRMAGGVLGCRAPAPDGGGVPDSGAVDAESLHDATGGG
jgi:hypothetical protein